MLFRVVKNNSKICQLLLWAMVIFGALTTHAMKEEVNFHFEKMLYSNLNTSWRNRRCNWLFQKPTGFQNGLIILQKGNKIIMVSQAIFLLD